MGGRTVPWRQLIKPLLLAGLVGASAASAAPAPDSAEVAHPPGLPAIGKWMLDADLTPAHWLGEEYHGKRLREPINVVLIDRVSDSPEEAVRRLLAACKAAGYPSRFGHSTGYRAVIGERLHIQLPEGRDHAFSSAPFELNNDHGRIFGPHPVEGGHVFIAAFSREKVDPVRRIKHRYVSFDRARDDFVDALEDRGGYARTGFAPLDNALLDHPEVATGDHDGLAVVLTLR